MSSVPKKVNVLFICLGNICRSPMGEIVLKYLVKTRNLDSFGVIDSCGTAGYHIGEDPDSRTLQVCRKHYGGQFMNSVPHAGRQLSSSDFEQFDLLLCMDSSNLANVKARAKNQQQMQKIYKLGHFDAERVVGQSEPLDVPDPYYGELDGFEKVFEQINRCCEGLINHVSLMK